MTCKHLMNGHLCIYDAHDGDIVLPNCAFSLNKKFDECAAFERIGVEKKEPYSEGVHRIVSERYRQIMEEGFDEKHDDELIYGDLAVYAAGLAVYGTDALVDDPKGRISRDEVDIHDELGLIEKHKHDQVRMLEIAGALIAAELDRVLRNKK